MTDKMPTRDRIAIPSTEEAEEIAVRALGWMISEPDLFNRFLALSGLDAGSIRQASTEPGFHAGITGFLMSHEPTLLAFCAHAELKAEYVAACHYKLNGPDGDAWL